MDLPVRPGCSVLFGVKDQWGFCLVVTQQIRFCRVWSSVRFLSASSLFYINQNRFSKQRKIKCIVYVTAFCKHKSLVISIRPLTQNVLLRYLLLECKTLHRIGQKTYNKVTCLAWQQAVFGGDDPHTLVSGTYYRLPDAVVEKLLSDRHVVCFHSPETITGTSATKRSGTGEEVGLKV